MASTACNPPRSTTTTIVSVRSCHVIKIDGYTRTLKQANNGGRPSFNSRQFHAGGRTWHVSYRPMGSPHHPENTDSISFYLVLDDIVDEPVNAQATFTLLDQEEKPAHLYCWTTRMNNFSTSRDRAFGYESFITREALEHSDYLKDGCFAVRVNIHVTKQAPSSSKLALAAVPSDDSDMHRQFGELPSSKEGADVEFRVGGEKFSAHRLVLAARSPVFRAELYGPMKEGTSTDVIQIDDMEAEVFGALLVFMYTDTLPEMEQEDESAMSQHLLVAADRCGLERLKLMCEEALRKHIETGTDSVAAAILDLAERHQCPRLKEACCKFLMSSTVSDLAITETED